MYKTLSKTDLPGLIKEWQERFTVYAPGRQGDMTSFQPVDDPAQVDLSAVNTRFPPKALFLPQSEVMLQLEGGRLQPIEDPDAPRVVLGMRPCDARALQLLDTVFMTEEDQDPYWASKRERTTIVALGCDDPCETCFCGAVGSGPFDERGADVLLTVVDGAYVAEVRTDKGEALFAQLPDAATAQIEAAQAVQQSAVEGMQAPFDATGIKNKLYGMFESDFWQQIQQSCLGCGVCTFLCPTCFCFDIVDEAQRGQRVRNWDTCMFRIYSLEASGHNPRPTNVERTRQRIMHKYAYWIELIDQIGCTGCGRCVRYCPVSLDIRHIIRSAQAWEEA